MSAPVLAEGALTFEHRAGDSFIVVKWSNGASIMLSRHDAAMAGMLFKEEAMRSIAAQTAQIIAWPTETQQ